MKVFLNFTQLVTHKPRAGSLISNRTRGPLGETSTTESLIIGCLIIYVFPIYVRVFLRMLPQPVLKTTPPNVSISPYSSISSQSLSILASSALICMRAVLRSALIARRGHLGIKKCQSPEQYRATTQIPFQPIRSNLSLSRSSSFSQRTITISFSVWSQSKIVLCTSCLVGWQLPVGPCLLPHIRVLKEGRGDRAFY